ncbi:MAG: glycosyltransferase family 4 protein [Elusimicrobiales bacterium]|nr:glycosyltransferase family 4 protein [Elusimicrobiales bacterium]
MTAQKIRVLYAIENERYGGGERAFAQLINGLDKSRFEVYAACLTGGTASAQFLEEIAGAAKVLNLDLRRLFSPGAVAALRGIIGANGIGVVHSQGARADFYCRLAARAAGVAAVSTIASPVEEYDVGFLRRAAYTALDRFSSRYTSRFVAVADHIRAKLLARRGLRPERVVRIYNGVDPARCACAPGEAERARAAYGVPPGTFLAAAFCRLSREKGLFTLLDAAAASGPGVTYLLAGTGPLEAELKARARELGLGPRFIFAGFVADIVPLLNAAGVVALPSLREGFPMAALEAMAAGKPVVASAIEGIKESVADGVTGLLVPPGDGAALGAAIKRLARDRALAASLGAAGREAAGSNFSLRSMIGQHEALYGELLG